MNVIYDMWKRANIRQKMQEIKVGYMKKQKIGKDAKYKINIVKNSHQKSFKEKIFTEFSFTHS